MQTKLTITFSPDEAERKAVSKILCRYRPRSRRQSVVHLACLALALALTVSYFYHLRATSQFFADVCYAYPVHGEHILAACEADTGNARSQLSRLIYGLVAQLLLITWWLTYSYRRNWRNSFHPLNGRTFTYTISADGLASHEHGKAHSHYPWHAIERIVHERGYTLFFNDRCAALFVGDAHFPDTESAEQFAAHAQQWWQAHHPDDISQKHQK